MNVGVIGSGTMGSGIAQVAATADCNVNLYDIDQKVLDKAKSALTKILDRLIEKGRMDEKQVAGILSRINFTSDLNQFSDADLVIEAIVENPEIKARVFQNVEAIVSDECIIASNTSSLSVTSLAASLNKPERFLGIHFFNPAPLMKLVEMIPAIQTYEKAFEKARNEIDRWGKTTVKVKDTPGFIVNKVARPFYGESLRILEEGLANTSTIDWAMKTIGGFRMGPFELMDFIGNDVNYTVTETVFKAFYYDSRYKPAFTQKRLSEAGYLGRKSGRGYYDYSENAMNPVIDENEEKGREIFTRVLVMLINEAADTLYLNIADEKDIDLAMTNGVNYPKGLLKWADEIGIDFCVQQLDDLFSEYKEERYRCCPLLRRMQEQDAKFFN